MKKVIIIAIAVLLTCNFYSCKEEFLDTVATDSYNEANWWQTEDQAISSLNGCYQVLRDANLGNHLKLREENITPNSYSMSYDILLAEGTHNPGNDTRFRDQWNANYRGIGRAND